MPRQSFVGNSLPRLFSTAGFVIGLAWAPCAWSLDCDKARLSVEHIICADAELKRLDDVLNANYTGMVYSNIGTEARTWLKAEQRRWVKQRNRCTDRTCLLPLYREQVDRVCELPVISGVHAICISAETVQSEFAEKSPATGASPLSDSALRKGIAQ